MSSLSSVWPLLPHLFAMEQKYYFFAQERGTDALFMVELSITMASKRLSAMVKGPSEVCVCEAATLSARVVCCLLG